MALLDDILALDTLTLSEHTIAAGAEFDIERHRSLLEGSLSRCEDITVYRGDRLAGYAMLEPLDGSSWFVNAFNTHPDYRNALVLRALLRDLIALTQRHGIRSLVSHVYKTNLPSIRFHRKLGFDVVDENERAFAFRLDLSSSILKG